MGLRDEVCGATELVGNGNKQRVKGPREEMGECLSDKIMPAIRETLLMEQWKDITKSFCFPSVDETPFVRTSPFHFCCFCSGKKTPDIVLPYDLSLSIYMYIYISFCWYEIYIYGLCSFACIGIQIPRQQCWHLVDEYHCQWWLKNPNQITTTPFLSIVCPHDEKQLEQIFFQKKKIIWERIVMRMRKSKTQNVEQGKLMRRDKWSTGPDFILTSWLSKFSTITWERQINGVPVYVGSTNPYPNIN